MVLTFAYPRLLLKLPAYPVTKIKWRWQVSEMSDENVSCCHPFRSQHVGLATIANHLKIENAVISNHHWLEFIWQCREAFYFYTKSVYGYGWLYSKGLVVPFELDSAICVREANRLSLQWTPALILCSSWLARCQALSYKNCGLFIVNDEEKKLGIFCTSKTVFGHSRLPHSFKNSMQLFWLK